MRENKYFLFFLPVCLAPFLDLWIFLFLVSESLPLSLTFNCYLCDVLGMQVANLIAAQSKEIIFTSGATESNNLAIKGVARFYKEKKKHLVTTQIEHKCVLDSCRQLQQEGFDVKKSLFSHFFFTLRLFSAVTPSGIMYLIFVSQGHLPSCSTQWYRRSKSGFMLAFQEASLSLSPVSF